MVYLKTLNDLNYTDINAAAFQAVADAENAIGSFDLGANHYQPCQASNYASILTFAEQHAVEVPSDAEQVVEELDKPSLTIYHEGATHYSHYKRYSWKYSVTVKAPSFRSYKAGGNGLLQYSFDNVSWVDVEPGALAYYPKSRCVSLLGLENSKCYEAGPRWKRFKNGNNKTVYIYCRQIYGDLVSETVSGTSTTRWYNLFLKI